MKLHQQFKWLNFFILISMLLTACSGAESQNPKQDIIGKWQTSDKTLTLEFLSDGSIVATQQKGNVQSSATIKSDTPFSYFIDDTHILGSWNFSPKIYEVHIRGNRMTLIASDGEKVQLKRIAE